MPGFLAVWCEPRMGLCLPHLLLQCLEFKLWFWSWVVVERCCRGRQEPGGGLQGHVGTKPLFPFSHSLQIVPIHTASSPPARGCFGGQPHVSSQLPGKTAVLGREGKGPLQAWRGAGGTSYFWPGESSWGQCSLVEVALPEGNVRE